MGRLLYFFLILGLLLSCGQQSDKTLHDQSLESEGGKINVYQVFTRLFGNTNTNNKKWGTLEENGVGKFDDFTDEALLAIKSLGITHIWYTGVLHHGVIGDYTAYGIGMDDPDVVKGRAGSPYAIKDYYNVNPDLAVDPAKRMEEFEALIARTHRHGMKVVIDIVPNHVARNYHSQSMPKGVGNFGGKDDTSVEYARDNNFYYIPGKIFQVPESINGYLPLGGESHPMSDGQFDESPAKWTGNGSREAQPHFYDWYETVKINFGVRPDGSYDFEGLPEGYDKKDVREHRAFWKDKDVPDSWNKFQDIAHFWLEKGVDGFRFDMAEMVPVEFWSYLNSSIKNVNPEAFLLAEVYNPGLYRDYLHLGKMDYLYDKVELYDTLKSIMTRGGSTDHIVDIQNRLSDIEHQMLHFLENHDEQRIASSGFAGDANIGKPAMVVSSCISTAPTMIYFGQHVGEPASEETGFGHATRTSIFDYWGVPSHQRWMNNGKFDGGQLSDSEKELHSFYSSLLRFVRQSGALTGGYAELHTFNRKQSSGYDDRLFSFVRWNDEDRLIIVSNFDNEKEYSIDLQISPDMLKVWNLKPGEYELKNLFSDDQTFVLEVSESQASIRLKLDPLESVILSWV